MAGSNCMTSTSIMTYTNGPDGRPQVYQASKSMRAGPGGVKETKESVFDSRSGTKKMAIGHHIGERAHIIEKKKDLRNGDEEEHQEFINLEDGTYFICFIYIQLINISINFMYFQNR